MNINYAQVTFVLGLIGTTAAGTWNIRSDRIEELDSIVKSYEKAKSWKIPETISKLDKTVEYLNSELGLLAENQKYKTKVDELMVKISELSENISMKNSQISALEDQVAEQERFVKEYFSDTEEFVLENNTSIGLFATEVFVALNNTNEIYGHADVTINNDKHRIEVGNIIPIAIKGEICNLVFKEFMGRDSIKLGVLCKKV